MRTLPQLWRARVIMGCTASAVLCVAIVVGQHQPAAIAVAGSNPPAATPTPATGSLPSSFHDSTTGNGMSIQLTAGRSDSGDFSFVVPGVGDFLGNAHMSRSEAGSDDHEATHPGTESKGQKNSGNTDDMAISADSVALTFSAASSTHTTAVSGSIEGVVSATKHTASVTLTVRSHPSAVYHLVMEMGSPEKAKQVAQRFGDATARQDYAAMYSMLAPEDTAGVSRATFISSMTAPGSPRITAVTLAGSGQMSSAAGWWFYEQPVTITATSGGAGQVSHTTMKLVLYGDAWFVLTTGTPS